MNQEHTPPPQHHHHKKKNWFMRKHFSNWFPCVLIAAIFGIVLFYKSLGSIDLIHSNELNSKKYEALKRRQVNISSISNETGKKITLSNIVLYYYSNADTGFVQFAKGFPTEKNILQNTGKSQLSDFYDSNWKGQCVFGFIGFQEDDSPEISHYYFTSEEIFNSNIKIQFKKPD